MKTCMSYLCGGNSLYCIEKDGSPNGLSMGLLDGSNQEDTHQSHLGIHCTPAAFGI